MKKAIMIAAMAALMPVTSVWAGDGHESAVPQSTQKISSDRLKMKHERQEMSDKMSHKERGPMLNSTSKKSSNRLHGERERMTGKMNHQKRGSMFEPTYKKSSDRLQRKHEK